MAAHCPNPDKFFPVVKTPALQDGALKGKIALVTGGGTGLGRSIATTFARLGASVAIAARRLDVLQKAAEEIRKETNGVCEAFQMDIRKPEMISQAVDQIESKLGLPNIVVNNAAGNFIAATERLSPNAFSAIVDIVLKGTFFVTQEVGRRCIEQNKGCTVLSITATYSRAGAPFVVPSATAKAGVEVMMKSLSAEWTRYGFRFNVIAPGPIYTPGAFNRLMPGMTPDQAMELGKQGVAAGRFGEREELANLAAYMCSDYSSWMNGTTIDFDGGQTSLRQKSDFGSFLYDMDKQAWENIENTIKTSTGKANKSKL
ncbi:hypothetical protein WR25_08581 [Diploscapter pachys]|uniref:Uncharacterized protein n=1 Tax=Diploscapter pachys TaxID=2018661 RepID=A0A2A2JLR6_9BILA|nr:hypothetical protein WR25_08581 [Diploscapter pachys]